MLPCGGRGCAVLGEGAGAYITADTEVTSAVLDSRQVAEGALFFATLGERVDGHRFICSAYEKGAYCVVTQKTPKQVEAEHGIAADNWGADRLKGDLGKTLIALPCLCLTLLHCPMKSLS